MRDRSLSASRQWTINMLAPKNTNVLFQLFVHNTPWGTPLKKIEAGERTELLLANWKLHYAATTLLKKPDAVNRKLKASLPPFQRDGYLH